MAEATSSAMHDARDAEDRRLLAAGDHVQLLANYLHQIEERCAVRVHDPYAAEDVAQTIVLRLWKELEQGKHRGRVPFRVVVWQVTNWMIGGHFREHASDPIPLAEVPEGVGADDQAEWEARYNLEQLAETLPGRQREMFELVYLEGLSPGEAAGRLGIGANAGYQALHNAHHALGELLLVR